MAIIVDLEETLCTQFDVPVKAGVGVLRQIDQLQVQVHYVTARTAVWAIMNTIAPRQPMLSNELLRTPTAESLGSLEHKRRLHGALTRECEVIASIGDSFDEEQATAEFGIHFVAVDPCEPTGAWAALAERIAELGGFGSGTH